jgi:NADP-dependent 3-hydroxy acid dehydrogenase YdfG
MPDEDVARAVLLMADLPPGSNVATMTILATAMPYVGRG